jgi:type I restriction enzyme S subunit
MPALRFPEFEGEWIKERLGAIAKVIDCKHRTPIYTEEGVPVVSPGSINWGDLDLVSPTKRVTKADYLSLMDHCEPKPNDLVMSRNQSVGISSKVKTDEAFVLGQDTVLLQSTSIDGLFLYQRLQTEATQNDIIRTSGGSTFSRINLKDIRNLRMSVSPSLSEQKKIAAFLGVVDAKLSALRARRVGLETYKRGLMQKLFSRILRFTKPDGTAFPDWEEKRLGEVATFHRGAELPKSDLTENGEFSCVHYGQLFTSYTEIIRQVGSKTNSTASPIGKFGDILMPSSDVTPDGLGRASALLLENVRLGGDINIIRPSDRYIPEFLSFAIKAFRKSFVRLVSGTTVKHLYTRDLATIVLPIPHPDEQRLIADALQAMDAKISAVGDQIARMEAFKKGLLQQMFV